MAFLLWTIVHRPWTFTIFATLIANMNKFYGTGVAVITPFQEDGQVDYDGLKNLINYLIDGGVEYLVMLGTTGENVTLSSEEKKNIWAFTAEVNQGRVALV